MPRNYSVAVRENINAVNAKEPLLYLLEITHIDLAAPIRVVSDTIDVVSNGNTYVGFPFEISLPDDVDGQVGKASLSVDNVGREMTQWLEYSRGGKGAKCKVMQILRSNPNLIEFSMVFDLTNISVNMLKMNGTLEFQNVFNQSAVTKTFRPETQAGLF